VLAVSTPVASWRAYIVDHRIVVSGELNASDAGALWLELVRLAKEGDDKLDIDVTTASVVAPRALVLIVEVWRTLIERGVSSELVVPTALRELAASFATKPAELVHPPSTTVSLWARIGATFERSFRRMTGPLNFLGELVDGVLHVVRHPKRGNWRSLPVLIERAGADAIAIVLLLDFLIGFVIALQSAPQLKALGANPYVADLVGLAVTRELAPLMTAIIMSGRSGAAYAAELGTMHVSDEIDALETMGVWSIPYLVIPRIIALAVVAPILVLLADAAAITGGLVVAVVSLDLTSLGYFSELRLVVTASDIWTGQVKGVVFAIAIAVIGCHEGLAARGAAAGVGRRTTATVVVSLFAVVVLDCVLTILFRTVGV
jgi:phospholipid/cholesterol/gamma-HCH transport system permease protein